MVQAELYCDPTALRSEPFVPMPVCRPRCAVGAGTNLCSIRTGRFCISTRLPIRLAPGRSACGDQKRSPARQPPPDRRPVNC